MIEFRFKASDSELDILEQLREGMHRSLVGCADYEMGVDIFLTPIEQVSDGVNGFIFYVGDKGTDMQLIFEDDHVYAVEREHRDDIEHYVKVL